MTELTREEASTIRYFWEVKGDPSDYDDFRKVCKKCPALLKAYNDWKAATDILGLVIEGLEKHA
jgi:hypothetical protein